MADFTTNLTKAANVDDSQITLVEKAMWIAIGQENTTDALISKRVEINAKSINMPKYARLAVATTPLVEGEDPTSVALSDSKVTFTPVEYGLAVSHTSLASLQTGGIVDLHAGTLVGINYAETMDALSIAALDASTNTYIIGGTAAGSVAANQVASAVFFNYFYNKLARSSVPKINGSYVAMTHDDVIHDLRADTTASASFTEVMKYAAPEAVMANEVGMFKGFRVIRNNRSTFADQTGGGTVDLYNTYFLGANALGKAVSQPGRLTVTGPYDKLGRIINLGWYEVSQTKILDQDALWLGQCASSVGANAS